jgi:hypothetical protein
VVVNSLLKLVSGALSGDPLEVAAGGVEDFVGGFFQTNGFGSSFQDFTQERMSASRAWTLLWVQRRIFCSVR